MDIRMKYGSRVQIGVRLENPLHQAEQSRHVTQGAILRRGRGRVHGRAPGDRQPRAAFVFATAHEGRPDPPAQPAENLRFVC